MSAEILRRAASLMRERAEAATSGPWSQHTAEVAADTVIFAGREWVTNVDNCPSVGEHMRTPGGSVCSDQALPNGEHIASWHPAVALAVADWLEDAATAADDDVRAYAEERARGKYPYWSPSVDGQALAVARAYLGNNA